MDWLVINPILAFKARLVEKHQNQKDMCNMQGGNKRDSGHITEIDENANQRGNKAIFKTRVIDCLVINSILAIKDRLVEKYQNQKDICNMQVGNS